MARRQTEKQKLTLKYMAEGMDRYHAMLKAGYSESYSKASEVTKGKGWQELVDIYLPEENITGAVNTLMNFEDVKEFHFDKKYTKDEVVKIMKTLGFDEDKFIVVEDAEYKVVSGELISVEYWKVMTKVKDPMAISNGVEKAIKIRGRYAPERLELTKGKYEDLSDEELDKRIAELKKELNQPEK